MKAEKAHTTGYAYDLKKSAETLAHIEECAHISMLDYATTDPTTTTLLRNVTAPDWVFVAVGFRAVAGGVGFPALAYNEKTHDWLWSRDLIWDGKAHGFVWSGGNYCYGPNAEKVARNAFDKECDGIVYYLNDDY